MKSDEIIASFIVRVAMENAESVQENLSIMENVELHAFEDGKQIITIITPDESALMRQYEKVKKLEGILTVELVFCGYGENGPNRDFVKGGFPDWLNSDIDAGQIKYNGRIPKYFS